MVLEEERTRNVLEKRRDVAEERTLKEKKDAPYSLNLSVYNKLLRKPEGYSEAAEVTLNFVRQVGFSNVHYFAFSSRPGTRAGALPQINGETIKEREKKLKVIVDELRKNYLQKFIGTPLTVLIEEKKGEYCEGFSENYIKCYLDFDVKPNTLLKVMPVCLYENGLMCKELE